IISKQSNLFQFGRSCSDRFAHIRKREEFGCCGGGCVSRNLSRCRRHACHYRLRERKLHLVFFTQCPRVHAALAQIGSKRSSETVEREYAPWFYEFDIVKQVVVIGVSESANAASTRYRYGAFGSAAQPLIIATRLRAILSSMCEWFALGGQIKTFPATSPDL